MEARDTFDQGDRLTSRHAETGAAVNTTTPVAFAGVPRARWKRADTTSAVGAGVLGAGIGLLLQGNLRPYATTFLLLGLVMHAWGMYDKHRLELGAAGSRLWWADLLYWGCWIGLLALGLYIALELRSVGGQS